MFAHSPELLAEARFWCLKHRPCLWRGVRVFVCIHTGILKDKKEEGTASLKETGLLTTLWGFVVFFPVPPPLGDETHKIPISGFHLPRSCYAVVLRELVEFARPARGAQPRFFCRVWSKL